MPLECFEVVVVDDGSTDETGRILSEAAATSTLHLTYLTFESPGGPARAREAGWRSSAADLVAFTDDDCEPESRWLENGVQAISKAKGTFVQGRTETIPRERSLEGPFTRAINVLALDAGFQTCNIFYRRKLLEQLEGFDVAEFGLEPGGEDADLAWRAIALGAKPVFEPRALVHHAVNDLGPVGKLKVAARWTTPMKAYARHRGLRDAHFVKRFFWKGSHYLLLRALVGLLLPHRLRVLRAWLVFPYLREINSRRRVESGLWALLPFYVLHDCVEIWAVARAAARYRHPMI